jgi:hypothetical protein
MFTAFVLWVCTDALFTDCQVSVPESWVGATAPSECDTAAPELYARAQRDNPGKFIRGFCESSSQEA